MDDNPNSKLQRPLLHVAADEDEDSNGNGNGNDDCDELQRLLQAVAADGSRHVAVAKGRLDVVRKPWHVAVLVLAFVLAIVPVLLWSTKVISSTKGVLPWMWAVSTVAAMVPLVLAMASVDMACGWASAVAWRIDEFCV